MSHDAWRDALRGARTASAVAEVLAGELPSDGLQHAGNAILTVEVDEIRTSMVHAVSESLRRRGWDGDVELAQALEHRVARTESGLIVMPVDLDELADVLDQSPGAESFIDLRSGSVWPAELVSFDQGPDDFHPDNRERWLIVVGLGSGPGYADMECFGATITASPSPNGSPTRSGARERFDGSGWHSSVTRMSSLDGIDTETMLVSAESAPGSHSMATSQHHCIW